jgi:CHAT domain-containing protein/tetratricopeptide (TPR) repeat protein
VTTAVASGPHWEQLLRRLATLASGQERTEFFNQRPELVTASVALQLAEVVWGRVRVNTTEALALAEAALLLAQMTNDQRALAHCLRAMGNSLYALGRHQESVEFRQSALAIFEELADENEIARTLSASILPLMLLGQYEKAFAAGDRARKIFLEAGNHWRAARVDINLGGVYYRQDRFEEALAHYQRAYAVVLEQKDAEGIAASLSSLAVCFISLGRFTQALETYQNARSFCEKQAMPLLVAQADYNVAYLYFLRGEYSRAIEMLRATRLECKRAGDPYHYALCNLDLSELYLELNLSGDAGELAKLAQQEFQALGMGYERAKAEAFEAIAMSQQGHAFQALRIFAESRDTFVAENNRVWPSLIDLYQALILFNEGRLFESRRLAQLALDSFRGSSLAGKVVLCNLLLARIALRTGDTDLSFENCSAALEELEKLHTPVLEHQAHLLMGQIRAARGEQSQAYDCYRSSRNALESLRSGLRGEEPKLSFFKNRLEVYELLVDSCLQHKTPAHIQEAFTYIEDAKSRTLADLMLQSAQMGRNRNSGQSELVRRIRDLREELNWYYSVIEVERLRPEEQSPDHIMQLEEQARTRESDLMRAVQEASLSEAGEAGLQVSRQFSLQEIRAALPAEALLIEYFQIGDRIVACVLGQESLEIVPVTVVQRISTALRMLQFQLSKHRLGTEYTEMFRDALLRSAREHLKSLYDQLVRSFRHRLKEHHLLFVPHSLLHYVPFHALFDGENYLIDSHTVSFAPSAGIYMLCNGKKTDSSGPALLLGVPDAQAPLVAGEVQALSEIIPNSQLFIGSQATDDVLREVGQRSRIVHIATHGRFRQDSPMFSSIRLGNSYLSLYDLYQLRLPAQLVTLSGCATGLNAITAGDELIGLSRGLFQAGAQSLLLSLWDVHDESTSLFMVSFYRNVVKGCGLAASLRSAMVETKEHFPHPYQWAPFVLMGKI